MLSSMKNLPCDGKALDVHRGTSESRKQKATPSNAESQPAGTKSAAPLRNVLRGGASASNNNQKDQLTVPSIVNVAVPLGPLTDTVSVTYVAI
jgi:hypothetical protein